MRCEECRWWDQFPNRPYYGICAEPQQITVVAGNKCGRITADDDSCGEFAPREDDDGEQE